MNVKTAGETPVASKTNTAGQRPAPRAEKLEANPSTPEFIVTVHGLGYKFVG